MSAGRGPEQMEITRLRRQIHQLSREIATLRRQVGKLHRDIDILGTEIAAFTNPLRATDTPAASPSQKFAPTLRLTFD
jgi:septal ring factor EnvC (AmiA/AmiB activator)